MKITVTNSTLIFDKIKQQNPEGKLIKHKIQEKTREEKNQIFVARSMKTTRNPKKALEIARDFFL